MNSSVSSLVVVFVFRLHICESPLCPLVPINVAECRKRVVTWRKKVVTCRKATLSVLKSYFYFPPHPEVFFYQQRAQSRTGLPTLTVSSNFRSRQSQPLLDACLHLICPCRLFKPDVKLSIYLRCFEREEDNRPLPCTMLQSNPIHISYSFCGRHMYAVLLAGKLPLTTLRWR